MAHQQSDFDNYKNMIWKFRRNLQYAANNKKLYPLIGDREIDISQNLADKIRNNPNVHVVDKKKVTSIHQSFVKFVWML